jgi:hypothetical protein
MKTFIYSVADSSSDIGFATIVIVARTLRSAYLEARRLLNDLSREDLIPGLTLLGTNSA